MTTPYSGLPDTKPQADSPSSGPRPEHSRSASRPRCDQLLTGLALAAAGLALLLTGLITLPAAKSGLRLVGLTAESESGTHGRLARIERTLRRIARADTLASYEWKVQYPAILAPGRDLVMEAIQAESLGRLDSAIRLCSMAVLAYDQALHSLDGATEEWALGVQLRDWAVFHNNRIAQKTAATNSFQIQIAVACVSIVLGIVLLLIGLWAMFACRTEPQAVPAPLPAPGAGTPPITWTWLERLALLSHLADKRSSQDSVLWSVFGAFWATNALLLVALFNDGHAPTRDVLRVVSLVGMFAALTWTIIQLKAFAFLGKIEEAMRYFQDTNPPPGLPMGWPVPPGPKHIARVMMGSASVISFLGWLVAFAKWAI